MYDVFLIYKNSERKHWKDNRNGPWHYYDGETRIMYKTQIAVGYYTRDGRVYCIMYASVIKKCQNVQTAVKGSVSERLRHKDRCEVGVLLYSVCRRRRVYRDPEITLRPSFPCTLPSLQYTYTRIFCT